MIKINKNGIKKLIITAMLCLVANAASGAFGAIGIPVGVIDTLHLPGDVSATNRNRNPKSSSPF
jgi:L-lactate permease